MAQQCCGDGGGGIAANRAKPSSSAAAAIASGEDRLSAFPDDVLVPILLGLDTTAEAVRTSVLSHCWRRVWALLPELRFNLAPDGGRRIREDIGDFPYLMEDITVLPRIDFFTIALINEGHTFGTSLFHVLRLCTGIRRLSLVLLTSRFVGGAIVTQSARQSGWNCDQPTNWKAEGLLLNHLKLVDIANVQGAEHEVVFLKRLFIWATVLKKMRITFDFSVSESKAWELIPILSSFSRPEIRVEFYMYRGADDGSVILLDPEGQGTAV